MTTALVIYIVFGHATAAALGYVLGHRTDGRRGCWRSALACGLLGPVTLLAAAVWVLLAEDEE
jgi:hypothetical protein